MTKIPCPRAFAEAVADYHGRPVADFSAGDVLRSACLEALGDVPAQSLAAFVALDLGDDAEAHDRLADVVSRVKEAARLFNQMKGGGNG
jgi:hypothetical protein